MRGWFSDLRGARTQHDVARAVGITQNYYSMIETGRRAPRVALAMRRLTAARRAAAPRCGERDCAAVVPILVESWAAPRQCAAYHIPRIETHV